MTKRHFAFMLVLTVVGSPSTWAQMPTGREVMEAYKVQDRTEDTRIEMQMRLINPGGGTRERQLTMEAKTLDDGNQMQLIRFQAPADVRGTGFLSIEHDDRDDDNWLYLPALRKTRRIAGTDKQDSFVGSDFAYEDLDPEDIDAYAYENVGSDSVDGAEAWLIEAVPTDPEKIEETAYGRRELWISKNHHVILQAKYYSAEGEYVKLFRAEDVRQVPGTRNRRAYRLTMEDVQEGSRTLLEISSYEIDKGVSEDHFTQRYLKRRL